MASIVNRESIPVNYNPIDQNEMAAGHYGSITQATGFSPELAITTVDSTKDVFRLIKWIGDLVTYPIDPITGVNQMDDTFLSTNPRYIGASGLVDNTTNAINVRGAQGVQGNSGSNGADGTIIRYGNTNPSDGYGVNGDFFIDNTHWWIYGPKGYSTTNSWVGAPNASLIGPPRYELTFKWKLNETVPIDGIAGNGSGNYQGEIYTVSHTMAGVDSFQLIATSFNNAANANEIFVWIRRSGVDYNFTGGMVNVIIPNGTNSYSSNTLYFTGQVPLQTGDQIFCSYLVDPAMVGLNLSISLYKTL